MAAQVTTTINPLSLPGHRGVDAQTVFVTKQEAFQDDLTGLSGGTTDGFVFEVNQVAGEMNAIGTEVEANALAAENAKNAAQTAQTAAETARTGAEVAQAAAEAIYDNFDDRYLGTKATEPTVDNDGNPLTSGALYYNSTTNKMYVYDTVLPGWIDLSYIPTLLTNLSDVLLGSLSDGQVLRYDSVQGKWINYDLNNIFYSKALMANTTGRLNRTLLDLPMLNTFSPINGVGSVTSTIASASTRITRQGLLTYLAINEDVFEQLGFLGEPSSTNLKIQSEDITTDWLSVGTPTLTANTTIAPDGNTTADTMTATVTTSTAIYKNITVVDATKYTESIFVKYDTSKYVMLQQQDGAGAGRRWWFDLQNGVIASTSALGSGWSNDGYSIEKIGDYYRIQATTTTVGTTNQIAVYLADTDGTTTTSVGKSVILWGAQLEALPYATSYIPTTTASVTRAYKSQSFTTDGNLPNIDNDATFEFELPDYRTQNESKVLLSNYVDANNSIRIIVYTSGSLSLSTVSNGTTITTTIPAGTLVSGNSYKIKITVESGICKIYVNGVLKVTGTGTHKMPTQLVATTCIGLNQETSGSFVYFGHINLLKTRDFALNETEVALG